MARPVRSSLVVLAACLGVGLTASGQIAVTTLDEAKPFAPGANVSGLTTLNPNAWQGTSAARAVYLLQNAPVQSVDPIVREMLRQVALSGLVPPDGHGPEFDAARMTLARAVATRSEYDSFAQRNAGLASDPVRRADERLARGDLDGACEISDQLTEGRGNSYWVRLRAACHEARGETAAAELARDILRDRDEDVDIEIAVAPEGFWAEVEMRLGDPDQLSAFMRAQAYDPTDEENGETLAGAEPAIPGALDMIADGEQGVAQAYILAEQGAADALAFAAQAALAAGLDPHRVIDTNPGFLNPEDMVAADLPLFTEHAVIKRDLGLLQALYRSAPPDTQEALALASDALGGGFVSGPLGDGIDGRLREAGDVGATARRDALIAMALGATLSDAADIAFRDVDEETRGNMALALTALDVSSQSGSRVETLLRAAMILDESPTLSGPDLYRLLRALRQAGFSDLAGQIAARDFLREIEPVTADE